MLLTDAFIEYLQFERNYSVGTVAYYKADILELQNFIKDQVGDLTPSEVDAGLIREWIINLMDKGLQASTINRKLSSIRSYFKFLLRRGEVEADPLRKVVAPKKRKALPVFLKESEMDRVLDDTDFGDGFKGCRDRLIIEMFYVTGVRLAELIGLDDADVDFSLAQIKVTGKRNKQRLIPFGEELKNLMSEYVGMRNDEIPVRSNAFFVRENGERLSRSFVTNLVKRTLSKVVAIKKKVHTCCGILLQQQCSITMQSWSQ